MNIAEYTGYFHDGSILDIQHHGSNVEFILESCQVDTEFKNRNLLSKRNTLTGKLVILDVKKIVSNDVDFSGVLVKRYDDGGILDLDIKDTRLTLLIEWVNFPPKERVSDIEELEISGENLHWENIPDLPIPDLPD